MFLKRFVKDIIARLKIIFLRHRNAASIMMYHSVAQNQVFFTVRPEVFEKQMVYLKKNNYHVTRLSELVGFLQTGQDIPDKTVVLTFDDGYRDNYEAVWPILKKYNFPATIFLIAGKVEQSVRTSQEISLDLLNWKQVQEMHDSGLVDFEPHGLTHQKLTDLSDKDAEYEIKECKGIIEQKLNKECLFFAAPKGRYSERVIEAVRRAGFRAALAIEPGPVRSGDDLFRLKRNSVNSTISLVQFRAKL